MGYPSLHEDIEEARSEIQRLPRRQYTNCLAFLGVSQPEKLTSVDGILPYLDDIEKMVARYQQRSLSKNIVKFFDAKRELEAALQRAIFNVRGPAKTKLSMALARMRRGL